MEEERIPEVELERLVAELAAELEKLRARGSVPAMEGDLVGFVDQSSFRRFEEMLKGALEANRMVEAKRFRADRLAARQREVNERMLEMVTAFFEAYRAMAYRVTDLSRMVAALAVQVEDAKRVLALEIRGRQIGRER